MALRPVEYDPETGSLWVRDPATGRASRIAAPKGEDLPPPLDFEKLAEELAGQFPSREELAASLEATGAALEALKQKLEQLELDSQSHGDWLATQGHWLKEQEGKLTEAREMAAVLLGRPAAPQSHWRPIVPSTGPLTRDYDLVQGWPTPPGPGLVHASVDLRLVNEGPGSSMIGVDVLALVHNGLGELLVGVLQQLQLTVGPGETLTTMELRGPIPGAGPEGQLRLEARVTSPLARGRAEILGGIVEIRESEDSVGALA